MSQLCVCSICGLRVFVNRTEDAESLESILPRPGVHLDINGRLCKGTQHLCQEMQDIMFELLLQTEKPAFEFSRSAVP